MFFSFFVLVYGVEVTVVGFEAYGSHSYVFLWCGQVIGSSLERTLRIYLAFAEIKWNNE